MGKTSIEWTDRTWSPIRVRVKADAPVIAREKGYTSLIPIAERMVGRVGPHCEHVSPGCENCYAGTNNRRCLPSNGTGLPYDRRSRDLVETFVDERIMLEPLKWKDPQRIFVENQSDLFGEWVTWDMINRVFAIAALCPQHTFQILTKRPEVMRQYVESIGNAARDGKWFLQGAADEIVDNCAALEDHPWPLPNVHLGVSCEDQAAADKRISLLLQLPAAVRFISAEPLLGPLDLNLLPRPFEFHMSPYGWTNWLSKRLHWVIAGGESGPGARPCNVDWIHGIVEQCKASGVPVFVKQLGAHVIQGGERRIKRDKKGGDMHEWPHEISIREFPR
jgi:protein gp37